MSPERTEDSLLFADPEGLEHELQVTATEDEPLSASAPEIPSEHALQGFDGVRAYSDDPARSEGLLGETLGFAHDEDDDGRWEARGEQRSGFYAYDAALPETRARCRAPAPCTTWRSPRRREDEEAWRERLAAAGARPTPVIDRFYFRSVYFREPSGVLFEIATIGPGFAVDEDEEHLGERLSLPPRFEPLREQLESTLTPLPEPPSRGAA